MDATHIMKISDNKLDILDDKTTTDLTKKIY